MLPIPTESMVVTLSVYTHVILGVLADEKDGRLDLGHLAEHGVEGEAVL